jgi:hypothetical protein
MHQAGVKRVNAHNERCSSSAATSGTAASTSTTTTTASAAAAAGSNAEQAAVAASTVTDSTITAAQYTIQLAPQPHFSKVRESMVLQQFFQQTVRS